jgi:hypothetical protein
MKTILILLLLLASQINSYAQTVTAVPFIKEVRVNWANKMFEDPIPVDEPFIIVVYAENDIPELTLVRYTKRGFFYFYDVQAQDIKGKHDGGIASIVKTTSVTATNSTGTTTTITQEFNGDPNKIPKKIRKYNVPAVRADFYYSLMETSIYTTAKAEKKVYKKVEDYAKANTFLSKNEYANRKVTAIFGIASFDHGTTIVRPYLGFRYNFFAVNNAYQTRFYEDLYDYNIWKKAASRFSLDLGVTIASIDDSLHNHYDLFSKNNLVTGIGYKISNGFFISGGALWYYTKEGPGPAMIGRANRLNNSFYVSLSFDWDFGKSFDVLKKGLGFGG